MSASAQEMQVSSPASAAPAGSTAATNGAEEPPEIGSVAEVSATAWIPRDDLDHQAWEQAGRRLGAIGRGTQWWIGDWIRYGNATWGEKYSEAARITGYETGSLRNLAWVAAQVEPEERSDKLSWSHHAILASLDGEERKTWREHAEAGRLSVAELRSELRQAGDPDSGEDGSDPADAAESAHLAAAGHSPVTCPNCGHLIDSPADE